MSSSPQPFDIPRRFSLSGQAADAMRKAVAEGLWKDFLPSERRLCDLLQVSRPTVRTALSLLEKDGLIEIRQGCRIRLKARPAGPVPSANRLVGLVTHEPVAHMSLTTFKGITEMRTHLAEQGFTTEILVCPKGSVRAQRARLEQFVRQNRVFCCVLLSVSKGIQLWFQENRVPALVLGSCHPGVALPSLDLDYRSVCRHAVGALLTRGHRRLALVVPDSGVAGDLASEEGFKEGAAARNEREPMRAMIVRHNGTAANIGAKLDQLFASDQAPTALLVAKPQHVFIVLIYLLKRGLMVPDTVSIVARDYDHIFEIVNPPIAHYALKEETFANRLSRMILRLVGSDYLAPEPNLIIPEYVPGGTVKRLA
jgi:LacI family transcriptional regulator